jgi:flagellar hook-basal body complex protein FliE
VKVELLEPDTAPQSSPAPADANGFGQALDAIGKVLTDATQAEDAYARGSGSLQDAMYNRAQADVALSVATASAQRAAQAVQTLLNLQI